MSSDTIDLLEVLGALVFGIPAVVFYLRHLDRPNFKPSLLGKITDLIDDWTDW